MKKIDKYEVIDELGSGGMSRVYKCYDRELERFVAIKELRTELKENQAVSERFIREAKIIAKLHHPNIVHVYEFLDLKKPPGRFFVMEYVDGVSLDRLLEKNGILPVPIACYIAYRVGEGLLYAHTEGIIHRDIKPSNVMISRKGEVKIMDFGISRSLTVADSITSPGVFIGTPAYASPEQLNGSIVDSRSDIFSFGVMLYEMLTGRTPFEHTPSGAREWRYRNARKFNREIPRFINHLLKNCLKYKPSRRYQSMSEPISVLSKYVEKNDSQCLKNLLVELVDKYFSPDADKTVTLKIKKVGRESYRTNPWQVIKFITVVSAFVLIFAQYHYVKNSVLFRGPAGALMLSVSPWGNVEIKGHYEGKISNTFQIIELPAGEYSVKVENPFCETTVFKVNIKKDITYKKEINLKNCRE